MSQQLPSGNRHPADALAELRAEIRTLQAREAELREQLLTGECGLAGVDYVARIVVKHQVRLDGEALKKHFGAAVPKPFTIERTVQQVWLGERAGSNELE